MLVTDFLVTLTRVFFLSLSAVTVIDYLRHRDRTRRDVALVFVSLGSSSSIALFLGITGLTLPWLSKIGQIGIVGQPYFLLLLVAYFRSVPLTLKRVALLGWLLSALALIFVPVPLPTTLTLPIIIYFIVINGYAVVAFIRGAFSSAGIARHRLRFAAAGSTLLILLFVIAGLRLALPKSWPDITPFVQVMSILTILTYYLGFSPPRWLRQSWQFAELRNYLLQDLPTIQSQSAAGVLGRLRQAVMRAVGTDKRIRGLVGSRRPEADAGKYSRSGCAAWV